VAARGGVGECPKAVPTREWVCGWIVRDVPEGAPVHLRAAKPRPAVQKRAAQRVCADRTCTHGTGHMSACTLCEALCADAGEGR